MAYVSDHFFFFYNQIKKKKTMTYTDKSLLTELWRIKACIYIIE
jgi:hypothetical protein